MANLDPHLNTPGLASGPARKQFPITLGQPLDYLTTGIYVGTGGDLAVITQDGTKVTYRNVGDGTALPIVCSAIVSGETTCSDLVGWA